MLKDTSGGCFWFQAFISYIFSRSEAAIEGVPYLLLMVQIKRPHLSMWMCLGDWATASTLIICIWLGEDITAVPFYKKKKNGRNDINNKFTESN